MLRCDQNLLKNLNTICQYWTGLDNARPHRAEMINDYNQQTNINRLPWPTNSPDLNLIEHLWDELGRRLVRNHPPPTKREELFNCLTLEWNAIPQNVLANLARSMRKRCTECIRNGGGHTSYWLSIFCEFWLYGFWGSNPNNYVSIAY